MHSVPIQVQWLHLDPNNHVRHSAYFDFGAYARIVLFDSLEMKASLFQKEKFGPILFREEAIFKKEILFEDKIFCHTSIYKATQDFRKWGFRHDLIKVDGTVAATICSDGSWMNTETRKLTSLPAEYIIKMETIKKSQDFEIIANR